MIKFEGDFQFIDVRTEQDYSTSSGTGLKVKISASSVVQNWPARLQRLETELESIRSFINGQKQLIDENPAVREAYKTYITMLELAKEHNNAS